MGKYIKRDRRAEKEVWHVWFAWYPVTIGETEDGDEIRIWGRNVLRCGTYECYGMDVTWNWEYRELKEKGAGGNKKEIISVDM